MEKLEEKMIQRATNALEAEVRKRDEWYGLDNWTFREVVEFVLNAAFKVDASA